MENELRLKLEKLQNLIKRDSESYKIEFNEIYDRFKKLYKVQSLHMNYKMNEFVIILKFIGNVINKYMNKLKEFMKYLIEIIQKHPSNIHNEIRLETIKIIFRYKNHIINQYSTIYNNIIQLFDSNDKELRGDLFHMLIMDMRYNYKLYNLNQRYQFQIHLYKRLTEQDQSVLIQFPCLALLCEMWRRNIWREDRVANAIASAVFSIHYRVSYLALLFMNGKYPRLKQIHLDTNDDDIDRELFEINRESKRSKVHLTSRSLRRKQRRLNKCIKSKQDTPYLSNDTSIIRMLYDANTFSTKLFELITKSKHKYEYKILGMSVLSRIIAVHELIFVNFFEYYIKYLYPRQKDVMKILTGLVQASHQMMPPDCIKSIIETISNNFVSLQNPVEFCSVGINTIRELYDRVPLSIEPLIALDLIQYAHDRKAEKPIVSAARSLLNCINRHAPHIISKRDKSGNNTSSHVYGEIQVDDNVPGANMLKNMKECSESDDSSCSTSSSISNKCDNVCEDRILTDKDFNKLKKINQKTSDNSSSCDENIPHNDENNFNDPIVFDSNILGNITTNNTKSSSPTPKYNPHKNWRFNLKASTTNTEKKRNKSFNMVKYKNDIRKKKNRSYTQRVAALKASLLAKRKSKK